MFAKSKQIVLVSLFAVLATGLGGCAESVGNEPASFAVNRPSIALSRFVSPQLENADSFQMLKGESAARAEPKHTFKSAVAIAR
jgi:hypothetical protein